MGEDLRSLGREMGTQLMLRTLFDALGKEGPAKTRGEWLAVLDLHLNDILERQKENPGAEEAVKWSRAFIRETLSD